MLTAWGKRIAVNGITSASGVIALNQSAATKAFITAKTAANNTAYISLYPKSVTMNFLTSITESGNSASTGIAIGSGDTAPTENDYTLENMITTLSATIGNEENVFDETTHKYFARVDLTVSNNTGSDVTIKEIGRFISMYTASEQYATVSTGSTSPKSIMVDRTVLENPVTIPANNAGIVRYEFYYE